MNVPQKTGEYEKELKQGHIDLPYVTVRQSIAFLLLRLIVIEMLASFVVVVVNGFIISPLINDVIRSFLFQLNVPILYIFLVILKIILAIYVVLQWVNEYYKITPKEIIHKKGFIFKKEERYKINHVAEISLEQGFFGRIFNYGTIKLYDWATDKTAYLYLIHNPVRYKNVLHRLIPEADEEKKVLREHIINEE
jgi:uncharacterized membrane protein YdbT with pleckstrin-like domain